MKQVLNTIYDQVRLKSNANPMACKVERIEDQSGVSIYGLNIENETEFIPKPIELEWSIPAVDVKGVWKPTADFSKRIEADWELDYHESRISIDAPILSLFGGNDQNVLTFSCSNAINKLEMAAKYREEDNKFYCKIVFFTECNYPIKDFNVRIRLDYRPLHFSEAIADTAGWWESFDHLKPAFVPAIAKLPLYSTWYQFHQDLERDTLLKECGLAKAMGFEAIIIDDGWQTKDNNRGYDHTGDWRPEHFDDFPGLVKDIQELGLKVGLWFSVPFCGVKSDAYTRFKGKFLTENHRWAPVFDPRYPEVRAYLTGIYVNAVKHWNLDGLKLDFIDDFKGYPDTDFRPDPARVYGSITEAVDALLTGVSTALRELKPDIFIEFRQKYTGPAMRKYGNMLRAFDCPGDYVMNRVRIADIKMLCGSTAVHSDMVTWHFEESVETAALHYMNTFFGVPQISVMLQDAPMAHRRMISFYTQYWTQNASVFLSGKFIPTAPLGNYPIQKANLDGKCIIGVFEARYFDLDTTAYQIDVLNASTSESVVFLASEELLFHLQVYSCVGELLEERLLAVAQGINLLSVPKGGLDKLSNAKQVSN